MFQEREEELEDVFEELETVGRSLLDRLSIPVVFPDGYTLSLTPTHAHTYTHSSVNMNTGIPVVTS